MKNFAITTHDRTSLLQKLLHLINSLQWILNNMETYTKHLTRNFARGISVHTPREAIAARYQRNSLLGYCKLKICIRCYNLCHSAEIQSPMNSKTCFRIDVLWKCDAVDPTGRPSCGLTPARRAARVAYRYSILFYLFTLSHTYFVTRRAGFCVNYFQMQRKRCIITN